MTILSLSEGAARCLVRGAYARALQADGPALRPPPECPYCTAPSGEPGRYACGTVVSLSGREPPRQTFGCRRATSRRLLALRTQVEAVAERLLEPTVPRHRLRLARLSHALLGEIYSVKHFAESVALLHPETP